MLLLMEFCGLNNERSFKLAPSLTIQVLYIFCVLYYGESHYNIMPYIHISKYKVYHFIVASVSGYFKAKIYFFSIANLSLYLCMSFSLELISRLVSDSTSVIYIDTKADIVECIPKRSVMTGDPHPSLCNTESWKRVKIIFAGSGKNRIIYGSVLTNYEV